MFKTINEAIIEAFNREQKPLRVSEVFIRIQEDGLYQFNTLTPEHVVRTALRRHTENLNFASSSKSKIYVTLNDGKYWLKGKEFSGESLVEKKEEAYNSSYEELKTLHKTHVKAFKTAMLHRLKNLEATAFEVFCRELITAYGFKNAKITPPQRDGGLDGHGDLKIGLSYMQVAFECKRWTKTTIGRPLVDQFRGAIQGKYQQGIYFTTSSFTKEAKSVSFQSGAVPIVLFDGPAIVDIMIEKEFGVEFGMLPIYKDALDEVFNDKE